MLIYYTLSALAIDKIYQVGNTIYDKLTFLQFTVDADCNLS